MLLVDFITAILAGIWQGIFEWLPISSQGNLMILMVGMLGLSLEEALRYSIWIHAGTLMSAVVYFRKDLATIIRKRKEYSFIVTATVLSAVVGAPLYFLVSNFQVQQGAVAVALIGLLLVVTGIVQLTAKEKQGIKHPDTRSAVLTGIAQGFSALPGISRSGTTTSALLLQGFSGEEALRLSFLLSIPLVLGAEVFLGVFEPTAINAYSLVSALVAFLVGLLGIDTFLKIARRVRFGWLCIGLGILATIPLLF